MQTVLITDSCCDLPYEYVTENNIQIMSLTVNISGKEVSDDLGQGLTYETFYEAIRNGEMPTTSQVNVFVFKEAFSKCVAEGKRVIYIGFSLALSGSVSSAQIAAKEIKEENPEADITIINSKSASLGLGLLVYYANQMLQEGQSKEAIVEWVEANKLKVNHWFTVMDLNHLCRGGRVSKTVATFGTLLHIKPILQVNDEGLLIPIDKIKGRKKSIKTLFEKLKENIINPKEQVIFISHGDCLEEALSLKEMIVEQYKVKNVIINPIGATIGAHAGPGTLAVFFIGDKR